MSRDFQPARIGAFRSAHGIRPAQKLPLPKPGHDAHRAVLMLEAARAGNFPVAGRPALSLLERSDGSQNGALAVGRHLHPTPR